MKKIFTTLLIFVVLVLVAIFGYVSYVNNNHQQNVQTQPDQVADWKTYKNNEYGFEITFPDSWKGYSVIKSSWTGQKLEESGTITGTLIIFRNPNWTANQHWQDIPIMVFTPSTWKLIEEEKISVSAAPIGPGKIGQNQNFVFATPPRWYGFTEDVGWQEAPEIVKTFRALQ